MKRTVLGFAGLTIALSLLWVGFVGAANVRNGDSPHIMSDEVIDGTLYTAGKDIKMQGTVQGDVMCAGQNVDISGTVQGDVLCAAQNISISGHVEGSVRVVAQLATVSGRVDGSASIVGQGVNTKADAIIGRDVTVIAQQATLEGAIGRDAEVMADNFTGSAKIGRDLDVTASLVTLQNKVEVPGNFMYVSTPDATIANGAHIAGKTEHKMPETKAHDGGSMLSPAAYVTSVVFSFSSFLLIGVALLVASPRLVDATASALKTSPFGTLGAGLIGLVVPPFVSVLLFVTIIGIPLGIVLLLGWIISLMIGMIFTAQVAGRMIITKLQWQGAWQHFASLVLGLFVLFLAALIPFIGGFVMFGAVVWGVGAQWYAIVKHRGPGPVVTEPKKA